MGEIIQNFAAIHKNIAPRPLSINLTACPPGGGGANSSRTNLGRGFGRRHIARNRYEFDIISICLVLTTTCTGIGRNVSNEAFLIWLVAIISVRKSNKKTTWRRFLLGSNVAQGICIKTPCRQERTAENQAPPLQSQNKEHRKRSMADAPSVRFRYRPTLRVRRTGAWTV